MTSRRKFIFAAAAVPLVLRNSCWAGAAEVPRRIKAFCVDFNWYRGVFAPPGHWADASPEEHVNWYVALGANTIQTFCVSCNGYAWYKGGFVPPQPGLDHDFLTDVVRLGHERGIFVAGYFCIGANSKWGHDHPALSYGTPSTEHIPFTDKYLDYLARSMEDAMRRTGLDGYMIDWVWNPDNAVRSHGWIDSEKELFEQLTRKPFPAGGAPSQADKLLYERRAVDRCWQRIRETRDRVSPRCKLWLCCNKLTDPAVINSKLLRECDWVMNENPSRSLLEEARRMTAPKARLIQNVVGWAEHDSAAFLARRENRTLDLYGFAEPRDDSLPLPVATYLSRPLSSFTGKNLFQINDRNIAALARFYRGMALS